MKLQNDLRELQPDDPETKAGRLLNISGTIWRNNVRLATLLYRRYPTARDYIFL